MMMPVEQAILTLGRMTMRQVFMIASPILAIAVVVSLSINIVQVLTSLQETTISAVPEAAGGRGRSFFFLDAVDVEAVVPVHLATVIRFSPVFALKTWRYHSIPIS